MKFFARSAERFAEAQQARDSRNDAAMASMIGLAVNSDNVEGEQAEFVAPIAVEEIGVFTGVLRTAQEHAKYDTTVNGRRMNYRRDEIHRELQRRRGAAVAVTASPAFVPVLAAEIVMIERAIEALNRCILDSAKPGWRALQLLDDLHMRQGHSEALHYLGKIPAFRPVGGA